MKINNTFIDNFVCFQKNEKNKQAILHHIRPHIVSALDVKEIMLRFYH